jgi:protein SCO1/2
MLGRRPTAAILLLVLASSGRGDDPQGSRLADIGPAPEIGLVDTGGRTVRLEDLRGKAVLVSFIYTTCGGVCPATTHRMYRIQEALKDAGLWTDRVTFVSITLDPKRDTPEVLRRYASVYDADTTRWRFVTGPPEEVERVIQAWGMWARPNADGVLDHPSRIFLVDPTGRIREIYHLEFLGAGDVVSDIAEVLR